MKVTIAFYKGKGSWQDKLIRLFTIGKYSHCEVAIYHTERFGCKTWGDYSVDRWRNNNTDDWDFVEILMSVKQVRDFYSKTKGRKYDWKAILLSQILPFRLHNKDEYICSEWCAELLGLDEPHRYSPNSLFRKLIKR